MSYQNKPSSTPLPSQQETKATLRKPCFAQARGWLRSRTGRIVIPLITLLVGVVIGVAGLFLFGETGGGPIVIVPGSSKGDIIV